MTAIQDCTNYCNARFGPQYTAWIALSDDDKGRTLVSATDFMNELPWLGTATHVLNGNPTTLEWPRTGVFVDGIEVDSLTIPEAVTQATFELAVLIRSKPTVTSQLDTGSNIKSASAGGGVGVVFFVPTSARAGNATVLPVIVQRLIGRYLAGQSGVSEGGVSGVGNACSQFGDAHEFRLARPE